MLSGRKISNLQLAAELGKSLLERNRELEQGLQQMCSTNQEQLQEIEYLTKQVDLLRQVNDQHAKVYEQLDVSARELEQSNQKLVLDNRTAQLKIHGLMETVELLQTQVEELQHQVEELKLTSRQSQRSPCGERWPPRSTQSVCFDPDEGLDNLEVSVASWREEAQATLQQSLRALQTQFATERARREEAETEAELLARENAALEQQLARMEGCQSRVSELEQETEELRQLWKSQSSSRSPRSEVIHGLLLLNPEEENEGVPAAVKSPAVLKRWASEIYDHECSCVRRPEVVKYRGISLLNEVDAQYSALQVKYDELLQRCRHQDSELCESSPAPVEADDSEDDFHQPEYKDLFREIFSRIQKTKEDLIEHRGGASVDEALPTSN
uniref:Cerebellar degeneration related protein 2 n=1 Tax=Xiphophorus couchianus TaxID=32473 RepID=A0A3B5L5K5_9TELE